MKQEMEKFYMKGLANHRGPILCASRGNTEGEVSLEMGKCKLDIELRNHHFRVPLLWNCGHGHVLQCANREHCSDPAESKTPCDHLRFMRENRESPDGVRRCTDRSGKACGRNPDVYAAGKSDIGNSTVDNVEQCLPEGGGNAVGKAR